MLVTDEEIVHEVSYVFRINQPVEVSIEKCEDEKHLIYQLWGEERVNSDKEGREIHAVEIDS